MLEVEYLATLLGVDKKPTKATKNQVTPEFGSYLTRKLSRLFEIDEEISGKNQRVIDEE